MTDTTKPDSPQAGVLSTPDATPPPRQITEIHGDAGAMAIDMAAVQADLSKERIVSSKPVSVKMKTGGTYVFKYAALDQIMGVLLPIASSHRVAIIQIPISSTTGAGAKTIVAGEKWQIVCTTGFPMGKSGPQDVGSYISYARRYAILAIFGLTPEEDDGSGQRAQERHDRNARQETRQEDKEKGRGAAIPSAVALTESFKKHDVTEQMLVAEVGTALSKIDQAQAGHLRVLFKRLAAGEDMSDVLSSAAMDAANPPEPEPEGDPQPEGEPQQGDLIDNKDPIDDLDPI